MHPKDSYKNAFQTHSGQFEFRVMSFGLIEAPHSFHRAMDSTLAPLLRKSGLVFFDDILVFIKSYAHHIIHLEQVFKVLQEDQWKVKRSKCSFTKREISYLGYVISEEGVSTCLNKVKVVVEWPQPQNVKDLISILGLAVTIGCLFIILGLCPSLCLIC
jgi:hypothetical protein